VFSGLAPRKRAGNSRICLSLLFLKYLDTSDFILVAKYRNLPIVPNVINSRIDSPGF